MDKTKFNEKIGMRVRQRRKELSCTREQIAERANISVQFLFDIEKGKKSMTALTIVNLAAALSVSIDFLLRGGEKNGERQNVEESSGRQDTEWEQLFSLLVPEQRELAEEMLRLFVRGVSMSGKGKNH